MAVLREVTEERKSELRHLKLVPPLADNDRVMTLPMHQLEYPLPPIPARPRPAAPPRPVEVRFIAALASMTLAVATFGIVGVASHEPAATHPRSTQISLPRAAVLDGFGHAGFRQRALHATV
jgi:hypothetical protein